MHTKPSQYNPRGLEANRPIALRLMPDELADAERIATELNISRSNLARQAFLAGLPIITAQPDSSDD